MTQMPKTDDRIAFENAIKSLEAQAANIGAHATIDATARQAYSREIKTMAETLRRDASSGKISWAQAAKAAQETRNLAMDTFRLRSTPVGRSIAEKIKPDGYSLNFLVQQKAIELFGEKAIFAKMTLSQKKRIYAAIIASAGRSNTTISSAMSRISFAGRGVLILSVGLSVYTISTSTNKLVAAKREVLVTGASIAGGVIGGAAAGLACGPAAPVCVTVGAFVGGGLAAFGVGFL